MDSATRQASREGGEHPGVLLRQGRLVPGYTVAREGFDPLDLIRLGAFLGDEESREVAPESWCACCGEDQGEDVGGVCVPCVNLDPGSPLRSLTRWLDVFRSLAAKLPPKRVEVPCETCSEDAEGRIFTCAPESHDTPANQWLLALAAVAVGRECLRGYACGHSGAIEGWGCPDCRDSGYCLAGGADAECALDAAQAWVDEPTPERREAWDSAYSMPGPGAPRWMPRLVWVGDQVEDLARAMLAAAEILGEQRVREVASRAILDVLYGSE